MKRTIRLSESQLHNMISEAVKVALNEMYPETYMSASSKAKERGDYGRYGKFRRAAVDSFNDQYLKSVNDDTESLPERGLRTTYNMEDYGDGIGINSRTVDYSDGSESEQDYVFDNDGTEYEIDDDGNRLPGDGDFGRHHSVRTDAMDAARRMARGTGRYEKGKGWQGR